MSWKKNPASVWKLYCIIDKGFLRHKSPRKAAEVLFAEGADAVQLRFKNCPSGELAALAKKIQRLAARRKKILLINDRVDVALASGALALHAGEGDLPVPTTRRLLGKKGIIGKTVHGTAEARRAASGKIDYVSAGPVFPVPIKRKLKARGPDFIKKIKKCVSLPVFAIGGINKKNVKAVLESGADGICVMRGANQAKDLLKACKSRS